MAYSTRKYIVSSAREKAGDISSMLWLMAGVASFGLGAHATTQEHNKHPARPDMFEVIFPLISPKAG